MQNQKVTGYAWFVFILAAGFLFYKYLVFVVPAIITHDLMGRYALSLTGLGFLVSVYFYTYLLMQIPSALLMDRYGTRITTSLAILCCAISLMLLASHSLLLTVLGRLLAGFGAAFAITSYMKLMTAWFPTDYFPLMASFFGIACMAGAGTAEMPLAWLMVHFSVNTILLAAGSVGLIWAILFYWGVKDKKAENQARDPVQEHSFTLRKGLVILKQSQNLVLIVYTGLTFTPLVVFAGLWGIPFVMKTYHFDVVAASSIVSFSFFGFIVGGLFGDPLSKKVKSKRVILAIGTSISLILMAVVIYVPHLSKWLLTLCVFSFGFFSSTYLMSYALAQKFNMPKELSTAIALINMAGPFFCLIAEPLMGGIIEHFGYAWGFSILMLCFILALGCIILSSILWRLKF